MLMNAGKDYASRNLGFATKAASDTGTATGTGATSLTDSGKSWTTNEWAGHVVYAAGVYGVILSNTGTALTVDKWYAPATPGGSAGSTPGNVAYVISLGGQPARWLALSNTSTSGTPIVATDTTLPGELSSNGLSRQYSTTQTHTTGANTYTISTTWTVTGGTTTVERVGVFDAANGGRLVFQTAIADGTEPIVLSGDSLTVTETVQVSAS
jgi:hypothetical protein